MPSSIRSTSEMALRPRPIPEEVSLVDWPLRDQPLGSSLALTLAAGAGWLTVWATASMVLGGIVVALLAATLWRTWMPVRYQFGMSGIVQTAWGRSRQIPWLEVERYEMQPEGVLLFRDDEATPLAALNAIYIGWGEQREKLQALLEFYLPR